MHTLRVRTYDESLVKLAVMPGETYYVSYSLKLWINTVSGKLTVIDEKKGRSLVTQSKLALLISSP
ncbi:hypothetical protein SAMN06295970_10394 [Noviherbaspirillum suwonense]|uniref:Uncharacterized protein n=2 Tax=Noviherbaspirillum suwonense TaxID=1224511 RepID=A0ABY1PY80_9BURK|nr:hypothetical protein SAMN06295970_10394 [Noviherbaspirillum suwonense]